MKGIANKTIILHVLRTLYRYTSKEYPVTITQIANFLNDSGIDCDRRTVDRNIKYLVSFGLPVIKSENGCGYYYDRAKDNFFTVSDKI